ncbi:MAG: NFACT family protein [Oscillospiraceae bacterium]|nr:NFACT family protein [Oscillospiraceae bacterium]
MPLDAFCLRAVKNELSGQITGLKIDRVQQPERDLIILSLRGKDTKGLKLLISAGSNDKRVHLSGFKFDNPKAPPMFCMLLRKHISGAVISCINQPSAERVLIFELKAPDAMGVHSIKSLIIELIGQRPNIILTGNDGIIIDCLRRTGGELNDKRSVLPGLVYRSPPVQEGKTDPLTVTKERFYEQFSKAGDKVIDKWLQEAFSGFSPLICREISWRAYGRTDYRINEVKDNGDKLIKSFFSVLNEDENIPLLIKDEAGKPEDFSFTQIGQYEGSLKTENENSFSELLENFYTRKSLENRMGQRSAATLKLMTNAENRLTRKIVAQKSELEDSKERDYYRRCADIISSNFHLMKKGQNTLIADDFYSENGAKCEIKLDPLKTPQQNAAKYYKAYSKAKNAQQFISEQIAKSENELEYVKSIIQQLKNADSGQDLDEIRNELRITGYVKANKQQKNNKTKQNESLPHKFVSSSGISIYAGKNNIQNDKLTLKTAARNDIWFHAQKIHGTHVIVSAAEGKPDEATINEAAAIAAFYSAARKDNKVPVDYTLIKHVKKPSGGRPGMVIYTDFKTVTATPDENLVNQLRINS